MLYERHGIVVFPSSHLAHAGAETRDGQHDDVANLLGRRHAGEVLPRDISIACGHIEVPLIVHVAEDGIGPHGGSRELDDVLVLNGS